MSWVQKVIYSFQRLMNQTLRFRNVVVTSEHPDDKVPTETIFVVIGGDKAKWLILQCPCGCGKEYLLSLAKNTKPTWSLTTDANGRVTVAPSVHAKHPGCGAHFWIRNNRVEWAEPTPSIFSHW